MEMTREEAEEYLIDISYKLGNMSIEYLTEKDGEKMRKAITALEQELFINTPCVANQVCHEDKVKMLDKIRNEFIDRYPHNYANELELGGRSRVFSLNEVLQIIDKYESEE